ncbi:hypothetical protein A6J81_03675 [Citrobacter braakii]|nr:hypothetical protein A6J81_03675 [Citrobacter braakii]
MVALVFLGKVQGIIQQKNVPLKTLKKTVQSSGCEGSKWCKIARHAANAPTEWGSGRSYQDAFAWRW